MSEPNEVLRSFPLTDDERMWFDLRRDAAKQSVPRLNDALARLLTLTTALAGGVLAFLKDEVCPAWWRVASAACLFVALVAAAWGSVPTSGSIAFGPAVGPNAIAAHQAGVMRRKGRFIRIALGATAAGLLVALVGTIVRAVYPFVAPH